jgi:hypothetical protein
VVGSCHLRKTPFTLRPIDGTGSSVEAVLSTKEGDVYRISD